MAGFITTVYGCAPVAETLSVAKIVKLNVPTAVGVPLITPVTGLNDKPVGKAPEDNDKVNGAVPPTAVIV
jgi:hypothetical protein